MTQSIQVSNRPGPAQKGFAQTDGQLLSKGNYSELMIEFFEWLPKCEARKYIPVRITPVTPCDHFVATLCGARVTWTIKSNAQTKWTHYKMLGISDF